MFTDPLPEGQIYKRELIAGIWMIIPCKLRYKINDQKAIVSTGNTDTVFSIEEFRQLCKNCIYAEDPQKVYDSAMESIRNGS